MSKNIVLFSPIEFCRGIGPKKAGAFHATGINNVLDLLRIFPKRYEDRTRTMPISAIDPEKNPQGVFRAKLTSLKMARLPGRSCIVWAVFSDSSGTVRGRWFNQPYLFKNLREGQTYFLFGNAIAFKEQTILDNPEIEPEEEFEEPLRGEGSPKTSSSLDGRLTPVYPSCKALKESKVSPRSLRKLISRLLSILDWEKSFPTLDETLPFGKLRKAFLDLHWPLDLAGASKARDTMVFFDQVLFQIGVLKRRESLSGSFLPRDRCEGVDLPRFSIPFELTSDQTKSLKEILGDMRFDSRPAKASPSGRFAGTPPSLDGRMNRLLQGDVGSGKTIVAFLAMRTFSERIKPGSRSAFMAPTEILARQQAESFRRIFPEVGNKIAVLTGSVIGPERKSVQENVSFGDILFVFGTHALFQKKFSIPRLGFCVVDEQHKFGVEHRRSLVRKGEDGNPHLLLISATPIPRSLSLTIFGDLDASVISTLPPGRLPVSTRVIRAWDEAIPVLRDHLVNGGQAYFICPLVDKSEKISCTSVKEAQQQIGASLPGFSVASLTGQDSSEKLFEVMKEFSDGRIQILVATTVIEVGVDNPNATCMIVENSERFGLSQLHQLRGRIGRGRQQSDCFLVSRKTEDNPRLEILTKTTDGFIVANEDLRLRGPGDLAGTRQSGLSHPAFVNLARLDMIEKARRRALDLLTTDPPDCRDWFLSRMHESFGSVFDSFMEGG